MTVFGEYANFYDTLYRDKDYAGECDFLESVFARFATRPVRTILDLGCGTGGHVIPLAQRGYRVTGIDQSEGMLTEARRKAQEANLPIAPRFYRNDIRTANLEETFDAAVCMFAVMSYMITNRDLAAALETARRHLNPGGLFYFDAWFGPAVLMERPADRYKIVNDGPERIIRFVHPELDIQNQKVSVNYKVLQLAGTEVICEVDEVHPMRFFFPQEISHFLECAAFKVECISPFMDLGRALTERDWNFEVIAIAN